MEPLRRERAKSKQPRRLLPPHPRTPHAAVTKKEAQNRTQCSSKGCQECMHGCWPMSQDTQTCAHKYNSLSTLHFSKHGYVLLFSMSARPVCSVWFLLRGSVGLLGLKTDQGVAGITYAASLPLPVTHGRMRWEWEGGGWESQ